MAAPITSRLLPPPPLTRRPRPPTRPPTRLSRLPCRAPYTSPRETTAEAVPTATSAASTTTRSAYLVYWGYSGHGCVSFTTSPGLTTALGCIAGLRRPVYAFVNVGNAQDGDAAVPCEEGSRCCSLFLNALLPDRTCRLRRPVRFNRGLDRITVVDDHESCAPRCTRTATTVTAVVERATLQVLRRQLQDHVVRSLGGPWPKVPFPVSLSGL